MNLNREKNNRTFLSVRKAILALILLLNITNLRAQAPSNDNCANASVITIANGGFQLGNFVAPIADLTNATIQNGESFAPALLVAGLNQKSVWYKFSVPTTRSVRVTLSQPGIAIPAGDVGFAVYKINSCLPGNTNLSPKLTPIATFGNTYHPCVDAGEYMIQVSSKKSANGPIKVELELSDQTGGLYDHPKEAFDFGKLSAHVKNNDYFVDCQSIEDANETCTSLANHTEYTKSTWHTFTTPDYYDYISVLLASPAGNFGGGQQQVFGYKLYKGNSKVTDYRSLTLVDGCDSLKTNGYTADFKVYKCGELETNTVYTIQLFYKKTFAADVRLAIALRGKGPTRAPQPTLSTVPASNKIGVLPSGPTGITTLKDDNLACNSRHSQHPCGDATPANGVMFSGNRYNLSTFFTFELATASKIYFYSYAAECGPSPLLRVYKEDLTNSCSSLSNADLVGEFISSNTLECLSPGKYTVQVLGQDTLNKNFQVYYNQLASNYPLCILGNLGQTHSLSMRATSIRAASIFSLAAANAFDAINKVGGVMKPLQNGVKYVSEPDSIGCANTTLPDDNICGTGLNKAMYRQFQIADSGLVSLSSFGYLLNYKLYKGDANSLAIAQNANSAGSRIKGLVQMTECLDYSPSCPGDMVCATAGTYTLVSMGSDNLIGYGDKPTIKFDISKTKFHSAATAQDLGNILDTLKKKGGSTITSERDIFSCTDNAVTINGYKPCTISGNPATKAIYRQFFLNEAAAVSISGYHYGECGNTYGGNMTLFYGKASDGTDELKPVGGQWECFTSAAVSDKCQTLPAGWYTVVSYGTGPDYKNPLRHLKDYLYSSYVGLSDQFSITVTQSCKGPSYNRPHRASIDTIARKPYKVEWVNRISHTAAYPRTDTLITLNTEYFNCTLDTSFSKHPISACVPNANRVAYYVFNVTKESFVKINTREYWGAVYALDARTDSLKFASATPVQTCLQSTGHIELCKVQPGIYTLVVFASDANSCSSVTPTIYVDKTGYSRFDHASKAYDFGSLVPDSVYHFGKPGDINPLDPRRAASNDFFFCTTGSQSTDPIESGCGAEYNANIYKAGNNIALYDKNNFKNNIYIPRRNLWYTFVADKAGYIHVKVANKTPGKTFQYPFAIYKSNVDGSLPFSEVVSRGEVDSTIAQGLTHIKTNVYNSYCDGYNEISFYRDPCSSAERYYIVVDDRNAQAYGSQEMFPNGQVEVSILYDSVNSYRPKFDHYYQAYDFGKIGSGKHQGEQDNVSCATADPNDPIKSYQYCAKRTLWYKFTATSTGNVRFRLNSNGNWKFYDSDLQLFQEAIKGDSTSKGLIYQNSSVVYDNVSRAYWSQTCVSPGTYYLVITGCNLVSEFVYPEIEILDQAGDFCSSPVVSTLSGSSTKVSSVIVDCHTIGTDYGEFGPTLTCPPGTKTSDYKTSWFRIDITGKDTVDVTAFLVENTNVNPSQIQYRLMTGNCGAMQEQSCVQDAQTQNTYQCLAPGSYFIQVFTPIKSSINQAVIGDIQLHLKSVIHKDTCAPLDDCLANANFVAEFDCNKDTAVRFVNFSTYGSAIKYQWDFGYNNKTSTEVSPTFHYPALNVDKTYDVRLIVENSSCGGKDTVILPVTVPARPYVNLGPDKQICEPTGSIVFNAQTVAGTVYTWQDGSKQPTFELKTPGSHTIWVKADFNNCSVRDTVKVYVNPVSKKPVSNFFLCAGQSTTLNAFRGQGETYTWSNGATTNSIIATTPGIYWSDLTLNGCVVRDSFVVSGIANAQPLGPDTSFCVMGTYTLNATIPGATNYSWQDGKTGPTYAITKAGLYWVDIQFGSCSFRDSITISNGMATDPAITGKLAFCLGDSTLLDAGDGFAKYRWSNGDTTRRIYVKQPGNYSVIATSANNCSATSAQVAIATNAKPQPKIVGNRLMCLNDSVVLRSSVAYANYLWSNSSTHDSLVVKNEGKILLTVTDVNGCTGKDSVEVRFNPPPTFVTIDGTICNGNTVKLPSGKIITQSGVYHDTLRYVSGCDSVIALARVRILDRTIRDVSATICAGQSYTLPSGKLITSSGQFSDTLRYFNNCDSVITRVNLSIVNAKITRNTTAICEGQSFRLPSGKLVSSAGVYTDSLRSAGNCDSIVITTLAVNKVVRKSIAGKICFGASYRLPSGKLVNIPGTYIDTLISSSGCDSIITTSLVSETIVRKSESSKICQGQPYRLPSGRLVTTAGNHLDTLRSSAGCDSVIYTITLQSLMLQQVNVTADLCPGERYMLPSGKQVSGAGLFRDTLRYVAGCDSVITIATLTQKTIPVFAVNTNKPEICPGESVTFTASGGTTYRWMSNSVDIGTTAQLTLKPVVNTSYQVIITHPTCNSIDTLPVNIVVNPLPVINIQKSNDITCGNAVATLQASGGGSYLWWPATGLDNVSISNPKATPQEPTMYHVRVTSSAGCVATDSILVDVVRVGTKEIFPMPNAFTPNGDGKNDCFGVQSWGPVKDFSLMIFNRWGQIVFQTTDPGKCWDGTYKGQPEVTATFIYKVRATTMCGTVSRQGTVVLVR